MGNDFPFPVLGVAIAARNLDKERLDQKQSNEEKSPSFVDRFALPKSEQQQSSFVERM